MNYNPQLLKINLVFVISLIVASINVPLAMANPLDRIPIQDRGRVKPFLSFAQETMQLIHGSKTIKIKETSVSGSPKRPSIKRETSEVILTFMLAPEQWETTKIVRLDYLALKKALGFPESEKFFSVAEIFQSQALAPLMQAMATKVERKEKLNPFDQAVQKLESQLGYIRLLQSGEGLRFIPSTDSKSPWLSVNQIEGEPKEAFTGVLVALIQSISNKMQPKGSASSPAETSVATQPIDDAANVSPHKSTEATSGTAAGPIFSEAQDLQAKVDQLIATAQKIHPESYPDMKIIDMELSYLKFKPFFWAALFYFFGFLVMTLYWVLKKDYFVKLCWAFTFLGLGLQIYGFVLRTLISGRAPVTNMYETVVWVPLGAILFGMGIEYFKQNKFTLLGANLGAFLCLMLADMAPAVLDPTIQPLEPVLRSNFWLSTHVTIIVISYAAFFLAFVLGDINLIYFILDPKKWAKQIKTINDSIYRAIQIGILLLGIGIVLGGVWADYSWGRFWGWDPKETWALIALLGYLAVFHARLVGWVKQFGMSAAAVTSFSLVIMAWYGVNYVLGAGLHSYGFGAGGVEYVTAFVVLHLLFVGVAWMIKERKLKVA